MRSYKNKIITNTLAISISQLFSFSISFILFPFIISHLDAQSSGIWFFCSAITGYFIIFERGPGQAIVKFVAENYSKKDITEINKYVSSGLFIFLFFGITIMLVMFLFAHFGTLFFKIDKNSFNIYKNVFYLMGIILSIAFPLKLFISTLRGLQEFKLIAISQSIANIIKIILTFLLLTMGYGIMALVFINLVWILVVYIPPIFILRFKYPEIKIRRTYIKHEHLKLLLNFGGILFIIGLITILIFQTDRIILSLFLSISSITYYAACKKIYDVCRLVPLLILQAIMPMASELNTLKKDDNNKKLLLLGTKYSYAIFIPIGIFVLFMASDIFKHWIDDEYRQYGIILQILSFHLFFNFLHHAGSQILIGIKKIRLILPYYIIVFIGNIGLSLILVSKYKMIGIALGTTIPFVLMEWLYIKMMLNILDVKSSVFFREVILSNIPTLFASIILTVILRYYIIINNLLSLSLVAIFIFTSSMVVFLFCGMHKDERNNFIVAIRKKV